MGTDDNHRRHRISRKLFEYGGSFSIEISSSKRSQPQSLKRLQQYSLQEAQRQTNNKEKIRARQITTKVKSRPPNIPLQSKTVSLAKYSIGSKKSASKVATASAEEPTKEKAPLNSEEVLEEMLDYMGEMGRYQWRLFFCMLPFGLFFSWAYFVQMFIAVAPRIHYCKIPELASLPPEIRRNLSVPIARKGRWDKCTMFDIDWKGILESMERPPDSAPRVPCKHGWEYEYTDIPYETIATERNWVCDHAKHVPNAQAVFFIGALIGSYGFGWLADQFGRIPALIGSNLCSAIGGVATIFTKEFWDFAFCRFIVGLALDNNFMLIYILALEYVGPSHRTWVANMAFGLFYGGGNISLPWIAYFCHNWRLTAWVTSAPMFLAILAPLFMLESARWMVTRGRIADAAEILEQIAAINGNPIPEKIMTDFKEAARNEARRHISLSLWAICPSALLRHTSILMLIMYCGSAIVYDSLVRLSGTFGINLFITFSITGAVEVPAVTLLAIFLDRFGRRNLTCFPMFCSGILLFVIMSMPKGVPRVVCAVLARFFTHMGFATQTQWSTEILPTPIRASGSAALHMFGFAACLLSPFIVYSKVVWQLLPLLILGTISVLVACLSLLLPETKDLFMPQSIQEAEEIVENNCLFNYPANRSRRKP